MTGSVSTLAQESASRIRVVGAMDQKEIVENDASMMVRVPF